MILADGYGGSKILFDGATAFRCWWWYDTIAILEDYSDCCEATLPTGTLFTVVQIPENEPTRIICEIDDEKRLKKLMIPNGRQIKSISCRPKGFQVEICLPMIEKSCIPATL